MPVPKAWCGLQEQFPVMAFTPCHVSYLCPVDETPRPTQHQLWEEARAALDAAGRVRTQQTHHSHVTSLNLCLLVCKVGTHHALMLRLVYRVERLK